MKNPSARSLAPAICLIPLMGWWMYGLFDLDEGFYAAVVAEMNRRGEWITPLYNGKPWFEKPILLYWVAKPALALFGGEFGIRLPSILATLAAYGLVAWFGKRRLGLHSGLISALVLATSLFFVAVGRMVLVDPLLILCLTGAFLAFWESLVGDRRWRVASGGLLGLAVLAKGPVAGALFIAVAAYTYWRERELRRAFGNFGMWAAGVAVFALVVGSWYLPAYLANHQVFVDEFLIKQNLDRFKGGDEAHAVPMPGGLIYYVPVVLIGMIPWSLLIPRAWPRRHDETDAAPLRRYLATWSVVVFGFFTLSGTKLPHYVLPCFPPLALLVGHDLAARWQGLNRGRALGMLGGAVALCGLLTCAFSAWYLAANSGPKEAARLLQADIRGRQDRAPWQVAMLRLGKQPEGRYSPLRRPMLFEAVPVRINETSYPSFLFYLDSAIRGRAVEPFVVETDSIDELAHNPGPVFALTRPGRVSEAERARYGIVVAAGLTNPLVEADLLPGAP